MQHTCAPVSWILVLVISWLESVLFSYITQNALFQTPVRLSGWLSICASTVRPSVLRAQFLSRGQVSVSSSVSFSPKMSLPYTADWTLGVLVKYSFTKLNLHFIFYLIYLEDDLILSLYTEIERNASFLLTGKFECTHWCHTVWFSTSISSYVSSLDKGGDSLCPLPGWGTAAPVMGCEIYMVDLVNTESCWLLVQNSPAAAPQGNSMWWW